MGAIKEIAGYPFYKKTLLVIAGAMVLSLPVITTQIALRSTPRLPVEAIIPTEPCEVCKSACRSDRDCPSGYVCESVACFSCFPKETDPCEDKCTLVLGATTQNIRPGGCPLGLVCQSVWVPQCNDWVNRCVSETQPVTPTPRPWWPTPIATSTARPVTPTPRPWWPTPIPTFRPVTPTPKLTPAPIPLWQFWKYLF